MSEPVIGGPSFPNLFSPLRVGDVTLKNRVLSSAHDTVMGEDGRVTDRLVAYHEARAAGGVGLIADRPDTQPGRAAVARLGMPRVPSREMTHPPSRPVDAAPDHRRARPPSPVPWHFEAP